MPTSYIVGNSASSPDEGVTFRGTRTCSGSPLAIDCAEGVSTSSSPGDGPWS
jgi:hypothetical protein